MAQAGKGAAGPGTTSVVVAPIIVDSNASMPSAFSADVLRRELETALESTNLYKVPTRDRAEIDQLVREVMLTHPRSIKAIPAKYIISVTVEDATLGMRRRPAPANRAQDLISVSGSMALRVKIISTANGAVLRRMSLDVTYAGRDRLVDPNAYNYGGRAAHTEDGSTTDFVAMAETVGRAFANRVEEQVNPVQVIQHIGNQVFLSRGEDAGYRPGQTLRVFRPGPELRDPATGEVLGNADVEIGQVRVLEVRPRLTVAEVIKSTQDIMANDVVREELDADE